MKHKAAIGDHYKLGIGLFLGSEIWLLMLLEMFLPYSASMPQSDFSLPFPSFVIPVNGGLLVAISILATLSCRALSGGNIKKFRLWLWLAIGSSIILVEMQSYEGVLLYENALQQLFSKLPPLLIILLSLHVIIGFLWLTTLGFISWFRMGWQNIPALRACTWYWYGTLTMWGISLIELY